MDLKSKLTRDNIRKTREEQVHPADSLVNDQSGNILDKTTDFLLEHEGYEPSVYQDTSDIATIGVGSNLTSPATQMAAKQLNINTGDLRASGGSLSPEQSRMLARKTLEVKKPEFDRIKARDFPAAKLNDNSEAALLSMYYNNPKLLGPMLRAKAAKGDMRGVAREIALRSNKDKLPGIAKRRLAEAELFLGEDFEPFMQELAPEERQELLGVLSKIENPNERVRVLDKYRRYLK